MMSDLYVEKFDLKVIDLNDLFINTIQKQIVDDLHTYDLLNKKISNQHVKKFLFHHIIYGICEQVVKCKGKTIIYYNNTQSLNCILCQYFDETDIQTFLCNALRKVESLLPIKVYISKYSIDYLKNLLDKNDGKAYTIINSMKIKIEKTDISKFTFSNVKKFTERYDLVFLNKDYFNRLSTKLLLIR